MSPILYITKYIIARHHQIPMRIIASNIILNTTQINSELINLNIGPTLGLAFMLVLLYIYIGKHV